MSIPIPLIPGYAEELAQSQPNLRPQLSPIVEHRNNLLTALFGVVLGSVLNSYGIGGSYSVLLVGASSTAFMYEFKELNKATDAFGHVFPAIYY